MTSEGGYHIIGGGIVGASIAYHIGRRTNDPVHVYEKGTLANETTKKSLAFFGFYGDETQYRMKQYGMELYNDFLSSPRADPGYVTTGRLNVATSEEGAEALRQDVEDRNTRLADADGKRADTSPVDFAEPHELKRHVGHEMGPIAKPQAIEFVDSLPKTRSGKIMRRVLRARALGEDPGNLATMED